MSTSIEQVESFLSTVAPEQLAALLDNFQSYKDELDSSDENDVHAGSGDIFNRSEQYFDPDYDKYGEASEEYFNYLNPEEFGEIAFNQKLADRIDNQLLYDGFNKLFDDDDAAKVSGFDKNDAKKLSSADILWCA